MYTSKPGLVQFNKEGKLLPLEETLEVNKQKSQLRIGVPKETSYQENRVALVPDAVNLLVQNGHEVLIESDAGNAAHFKNQEYVEAGGKIVYSAKEAFDTEIILKVAPPSLEEIDLLKHKQTLISALQVSTQQQEYFKKLMEKKTSAIAFERIRDEEGNLPFVMMMSEIAGNTSILVAAEYLSNVNEGKGLMLGGVTGITPTEVVIIGAGIVGKFAARAAIGLGAHVKVFDSSLYKLRRIQNSLGSRLYTSIIHPRILSKALKTSDVAIGCLSSENGRTPVVVTEEMVGQMKYDSVIVDVSIDHGGCFETSTVTNHNDPVYRKYGVIHYCVPNIASRVARTASYALSNILSPLILSIGDEGGVANLVKNSYGIRQGVYLHNGTISNKHIGEYFNLPYKDLDLLMAATF
ncbi:MAG: alanine dehydrogenase [Bacteroidetes bacterium]|nr:alanine dehydrogenase [Bacteroidota bacterium]MBU1718921.1 alanine dehydrogenase [Bacteroidota bacterium]